jgi:preprotein translocase subunit SecB
MSDAPTETGASAKAQPMVQFAAQYVKDLSFENPNSPRSVTQPSQAPQVSVNVDVRTQQMGEGSFEVVLHIKCEAKAGDMTAFVCELSYGGMVTLVNISREQTAPYLLVEAPRLLFPFARAVIAEATRNGGFPPLLIQPIDFTDLFRRQVAALKARQESGESVPTKLN